MVEMSMKAAPGKTLDVALLAVILVAAALGVGLYLGVAGQSDSQSVGSSSSVPTPTTVDVFGLVSSGQGTHVVALAFRNIKTGANLSAPTSDGKFSVNLPNGVIYDVVVRWSGNYSWQVGEMDRGDLTVNMSAGSALAMFYNVEVETPPTVLSVQGTILQSLPSAHPTRVVYTASDGESFEVSVQNATFSTRLPNMMDYQVKVFWQYADGSTNYYFSNDQTIREAVGVTGINIVIS